MTDQSFCGALFRVPIFDPVNALHIVFAIGKPLINRILNYPSFSFSEIYDYIDKGLSIKSIIELSNMVPVST